MSPWRPEAWCIGLATDQMAHAGEPLAATTTAWTVATLGDGLKAASRGSRGAAHVLLCPDLCRHFVQAPPDGIASLAELRQLSAARATRLFGGHAGDWATAADWQLTKPFVVAAMPTPLLAELRQAATTMKLVLSVNSAVTAALARLARVAPLQAGAPRFIAWASPGNVALACMRDGAVAALRCVRRPLGSTAEALSDLVMREAIQEGQRLNLQCNDVFVPLAGHVQTGRLHGFDSGTALPPLTSVAESEAGWTSRLAALSRP